MAAAVALSACHRQAPFPADVVARYDAGTVTLPDVQKRIGQEAGRRAGEKKDTEPVEVVRARLARRMVAEQTWFERMTPERLASEAALQRQLEGFKRSLLIGFVQSQGLGITQLVSEKEARARYDAMSKSLLMPASYTLRHVYIRVDEGAPPEAWATARQEAESVRGQLLAPGANVDAIVAASSDSEDAITGGWIRRLRLGIPHISQSFEQAVRQMKPGEVSPPVETRRGYQVLLLVNQNEARTLSFDELRQQLVDQIAQERRDKRLAEILAEAKADDPVAFDEDAFKRGDAQAVVVHGPRTRLTLAELRSAEPQMASLLAEAVARGDASRAQTIEAILRNQMLYSYALKKGMDRQPEFATSWEERRRDAIIEFVGGGLVREKLASVSPEDLRRFYEDNKVRFATLRKLHLVGAFLEHKSEDLYATFARAEALKKKLEAGGDLKALVAQADRKGATGDGDFGWVTQEDLAARGRPFHDTLVAAKTGTWIGPVKWEKGYAVVRVEAIQEPATRPYEEVAKQVRRAYGRRKLGEIREALEVQAFQERSGQLNPALTTPPAATASR